MQADVRNEKASYGDGTEIEHVGPGQCAPCFVMVRKARVGYKFD